MALLFGFLVRPAEYEVKSAHAANSLKLTSAGGQNSDIAKPEKSEIRAKQGKFSQKTSIVASLVRLSECESQRRTNIKVLDTDGLYSYGLLQFHRRTLEMFAKRYGLRTEITEKDLYNPTLQMEVARRMIEESPQNWKQWYNCAKSVGII